MQMRVEKLCKPKNSRISEYVLYVFTWSIKITNYKKANYIILMSNSR